MEELEIKFYDPRDLVLGDKRVTLRLAREDGDKYDKFEVGHSFALDIEDSADDEFTPLGTILAHWKVSFQEILPEFLLAEGYKVEIDNEKDSKKDFERELRMIAQEDLENYYTLDDNTLFHIIVYSVDENFDLDLLQRPQEMPQSWLDRCSNKVFGHIESYREFKQCVEK
jgi:hypothetical protein